MSNSGLVVYTKISPNQSGIRKHVIDRITPHCVVGQCTAEALGALFADRKRSASSNYGIDKDGRVGMYVEENCVSWCSSSGANDIRAVTIECASDTEAPWAFRPVVYEKLIELCVDICKRNGKTKLLWLGDKDTTLAYTPAEDEMVLTVHRWFDNKSCPGDWLMERMGTLAAVVNEQLTPQTFWYDADMLWNAEKGIINDGRPGENVTRAELSAVTHRLYNVMWDDMKRYSGLLSDD